MSLFCFCLRIRNVKLDYQPLSVWNPRILFKATIFVLFHYRCLGIFDDQEKPYPHLFLAWEAKNWKPMPLSLWWLSVLPSFSLPRTQPNFPNRSTTFLATFYDFRNSTTRIIICIIIMIALKFKEFELDSDSD